MIVATNHFNMGAMENKGLNIFNAKYVLANPKVATDARLRRHRVDRRPRVLPQLDRQPGHLPRLVPVEPEGRPDRVPRPGVRRRHDGRHRQPRGQAHRGRAAAARGAVSRGQRPDVASGAARQLPGDRQLLHGHGLRERRRGRPHDADAGRRRRLPARHGSLLQASRRPGRHVRRLRRRHRGRQRPRPDAVQAVVRAGGHAARHGRHPPRPGRRDARAHAVAVHGADAGAAVEGTLAHSDRRRPGRRRRRRHPAATGGRDVRAGNDAGPRPDPAEHRRFASSM